jgi:hypothetical protein
MILLLIACSFSIALINDDRYAFYLGVGFGLRPKSDMVRNSVTPKPRSFGKFR